MTAMPSTTSMISVKIVTFMQPRMISFNSNKEQDVNRIFFHIEFGYIKYTDNMYIMINAKLTTRIT